MQKYSRNKQTVTILLLLLLAITLTESVTRLNYVIEHQVQQKEDYVQIGLQVHTHDTSLKMAIQNAQQLLRVISQTAVIYCKENKQQKLKIKCRETVQLQNYDLEPIYRVIKGQPIFQHFQVTYRMLVKVSNVDNIGYLVDKLLQNEKKIKLTSFQWKPLEEQNQLEQALQEGIEEGKRLCREMNEQLKHIVAIQQIAQFQLVDQEQLDQQQKEQQFQEPQIRQYKFQVQCFSN